MVTSARSLEFTMAIAGKSPEDFAGKRVMDLGSSYNQTLARGLEEYGATVVSVDPNLPHSVEYIFFNALNELKSQGIISSEIVNKERTVFSKTGELSRDIRALLGGLGLPTATCKFIADYREKSGWPAEHYGNAVSAVAQALPFLRTAPLTMCLALLPCPTVCL